MNLAVIIVFTGCQSGAGTIWRAQSVAGHPHRLRWLCRIENAVLGQAIAEVRTARRTGEDGGIAILDTAIVEADIVAAFWHPDTIAAALIAQHTRLIWIGKGLHLVETEIAHAAAFRHQHDILRPTIREHDIGDGIAVAGLVAHRWRQRPEAGHHEFAADRGFVELAILGERDRPHGVAAVIASRCPGRIAEGIAAPDGIINAHFVIIATPDIKAPDAAAEIGDVPAFGCLGEIATAIPDVGGGGRIEGDRRQRTALASQAVLIAATAGDAVVIMAEVLAGLDIERMDHAGLEIRDEEAAMPFVIGDVAERGAGVFAAIECHVDKFFSQKTGIGTDLENASGTGIRAPHAGHPFGLAGSFPGAVQAKGGGGRQEDVGSLLVLAFGQRHAEDLAHFAGRNKHALRFVDPVLARRRLARTAYIEDRGADAIDVDDADRLALAIRFLDRMREPRDDSLARLQRHELGIAARSWCPAIVGRRRRHIGPCLYLVIGKWRRRRRLFIGEGRQRTELHRSAARHGHEYGRHDRSPGQPTRKRRKSEPHGQKLPMSACAFLGRGAAH